MCFPRSYCWPSSWFSSCENLRSTKVTFLGFSGTLPLALALLAAAALGALLVLALGSVRIVQLRKVIHSRRVERHPHAS